MVLDDWTPRDNNIKTIKVFLCAVETFVIDHLILRKECNATFERRSMNKFFLNSTELVCPFDLTGIYKELGVYFAVS